MPFTYRRFIQGYICWFLRHPSPLRGGVEQPKRRERRGRMRSARRAAQAAAGYLGLGGCWGGASCGLPVAPRRLQRLGRANCCEGKRLEGTDRSWAWLRCRWPSSLLPVIGRPALRWRPSPRFPVRNKYRQRGSGTPILSFRVPYMLGQSLGGGLGCFLQGESSLPPHLPSPAAWVSCAQGG